MREVRGRHAELAAQLVESWEDLRQRGMTSRVELIAVPSGWGRTTVLNGLAAAAGADDEPVALPGRGVPDKPGAQAMLLRDCLAEAVTRRRVAGLLGLDRLGGVTQIGLGVGALFVSGLAAAVGFLVAGITVGAVGKAWDDSLAGQDGALARTARALAAMSVKVPVVVIIDDADWLDEGLAVTLIENLVARHNGHVLVVAAVDPGGSLQKTLMSRARQGLTEGRVRTAEADPDMGSESRTALVRELCPHLPSAAARRIGRATATFADVFAIASAPRLAELIGGQDEDETDLLAVVDAVVSARLRRPDPSPEAVVIAWAGGLVHARQAARALDVLGLPRTSGGDPDVLRWDGLERVTDPASPRLTGQVTVLALRDRQAMAAEVLQEALEIIGDPGCAPVEWMAAAQAAHRVRADLAERTALPVIQHELAAALEALGEPAAALEAAVTALNEWPPDGSAADRDWLAAAVLRLSRLAPKEPLPAGAALLIDEAINSGAITGLEARIWAAITMIDDPSQRDVALPMIDGVAVDLDACEGALGEAGARWRLLLAFHTGRAGYAASTAKILAPLLNSAIPGQYDAAMAVLRTVGGPRADIRLQNMVLEAELAALPLEDGDERLRIHHVLAENHAALGEYRQAVADGLNELHIRTAIQSPVHPETLRARDKVARWIGHSGNQPGALGLAQDLLPDAERILGKNHPVTINTRSTIAFSTGACGDPADALRLHRELRADAERALGPLHPTTLRIRSDEAYWTGECGYAAEARDLFQKLLPDQERVLGPEHFNTLGTRNNIAAKTAQCGDLAGALRLSQDLLPAVERTRGPQHPDSLTLRRNIAMLTSLTGEVPTALPLLRSLLPDFEQVFGPDHPETFTLRQNIADMTGICGDPTTAAEQLRALLPDVERVLGQNHPATLRVRKYIAFWLQHGP